jgi:putative inorganic carbon (HCO3(-)) transporter
MVLFFLLLASALRSSAQVDRLITALLVGSVPVAIYGWVQYFGLDPLDWSTTSLTPVHSTVGYSLFLGAYLVIVIPFTLSRILGGEADGRKRPFPYIFILVLQIMCLLFTLSRGAWLGLLGGSLLFLWLLAYRWRKRSLIIFSVIVLIAGSYLFISMNKGLVMPPLSEQKGLSDALVVQARKVSNNERMMLWINTVPMISRRYFLGYGPETYSTAFWLYYPQESFPELARFHPWDPHNIILYHLTATGVLGLLAFLWVLARFYRNTLTALQRGADRRTEIMAAAILSSTTAFLIQAQFNPNAIVPMALFWLVLALGVSIYRREGADRLSIVSVQ